MFLHYDPWGNQVAASGSLVQPMRYAGYYYDDETGLYYLKSRYYSPTLGRFLTRDAIGFINKVNPQTLNLYSYCGNNPISFTDPTGNAAEKLRDLVEDAGGTISWNAKTGIATVTVGGKTQQYDIDNCTVVNGRIIVDDADFFREFSNAGYINVSLGKVGISATVSVPLSNPSDVYVSGGGISVGTPTVTWSPGYPKEGVYGYGEIFPGAGAQINYGPLGRDPDFGGAVGGGLAGGAGIYITGRLSVIADNVKSFVGGLW